MLYREEKTLGAQLSALGLGCMRFPRDKAETERMVLAAIDGGVNYFDTAYIYPNSESTLGDILARHNKRGEVNIATKMPVVSVRRSGDFDAFFTEQLKRLKTDYVDFYLMHNLTSLADWKMLCDLGIEEWIEGKKKSGMIRRVGFSFHGTCDEFLKILDAYTFEFCLIQYNYADENYQAGKKGLKAAAEKGMSVMIMEPLLGGKLATGLPKQAEDIFRRARPDLTPVDWALSWLWNQPEVTVVLSGMSAKTQMDSNIISAKNFKPLTESELAVYADVVEQFRKSYRIHCTGCNYCLPCPKGINIPACFSAYNKSYLHGYIAGISNYITTAGAVTKNPMGARSCVNCGKCEKVCPQKLEIRKSLKRVGGRFEPVPVRFAMSVARRFLSGSKKRTSE